MYVYLLTLLALVFIMFFLKHNYIEEFYEKKSRNQSRLNTSLTIGGIVLIFILAFSAFGYLIVHNKGQLGNIDLRKWVPEIPENWN